MVWRQSTSLACSPSTMTPKLDSCPAAHAYAATESWRGLAALGPERSVRASSSARRSPSSASAAAMAARAATTRPGRRPGAGGRRRPRPGLADGQGVGRRGRRRRDRRTAPHHRHRRHRRGPTGATAARRHGSWARRRAPPDDSDRAPGSAGRTATKVAARGQGSPSAGLAGGPGRLAPEPGGRLIRVPERRTTSVERRVTDRVAPGRDLRPPRRRPAP